MMNKEVVAKGGTLKIFRRIIYKLPLFEFLIDLQTLNKHNPLAIRYAETFERYMNIKLYGIKIRAEISGRGF